MSLGNKRPGGKAAKILSSRRGRSHWIGKARNGTRKTQQKGRIHGKEGGGRGKKAVGNVIVGRRAMVNFWKVGKGSRTEKGRIYEAQKTRGRGKRVRGPTGTRTRRRRQVEAGRAQGGVAREKKKNSAHLARILSKGRRPTGDQIKKVVP